MRKISTVVATFMAMCLAGSVHANPTVTNVMGSLSKAENTCVSPVVLSTQQGCSYSGGEEVDVAVGFGKFRTWMGPIFSSGFYAASTAPDPLTTNGSTPGDGKVNLPITGSITIEDSNTPGNGSDDVISGTLVIAAGERSTTTSDGSVLEGFTSVTHTIPPTVVSDATGNAIGGFDYVIGSAGFPLLLHSGPGNDDYPSELGSTVTGNPLPPDINAWDVANGGNVAVVNMPPSGPPPLSAGPYTVEIVSYAPISGNVGPNIGVATTVVVAGQTCVAGDGAGNPITDCDPDPGIGAGPTWAVSGAEYDNLIIQLSTNAVGKIVSAEAFYTLEYKIPAQNVNLGNPGSFVGGTLNFAVIANDADNDGVDDSIDNCTTKANADQRDTNGDGYGNICDADLNNDGLVTITDFLILRSVLNTVDADADLNGDLLVTITDFLLLRNNLNQPPGPSDVAP